MKIGQNLKFCPIFDATLVHEFVCDSIAEPNPRYPTAYDSHLVDDALKEPLQHHWIKRLAHDVINSILLCCVKIRRHLPYVICLDTKINTNVCPIAERNGLCCTPK